MPNKIPLHVFAAANVVLLLGTLYNKVHTSSEDASAYTWIAHDYPFKSPVGSLPPVEMTFQESSRFDLSYDDSIANWQELDGNEYGVGYQLVTDTNLSSTRHWEHCLMYLRQVFICNPDVTLEPGDLLMKNLTIDREGVTRKCRDWKMVDDWMNEKFRELFTLNMHKVDV
ncbi:hypothetical protein QCA50_007383 [Cerrena zonata]|uniref:Uncharacterized protein n=1 Tax=Cerrena zonata TaxID=2478898 RepID=A0AAW0G9V5_9APHY